MCRPGLVGRDIIFIRENGVRKRYTVVVVAGIVTMSYSFSFAHSLYLSLLPNKQHSTFACVCAPCVCSWKRQSIACRRRFANHTLYIQQQQIYSGQRRMRINQAIRKLITYKNATLRASMKKTKDTSGHTHKQTQISFLSSAIFLTQYFCSDQTFPKWIVVIIRDACGVQRAACSVRRATAINKKKYGATQTMCIRNA